jgi:predicted metal-dependent phosphoesterase TrpH
MQKIEGIELSTVEGGSTITITGDVNAETLAPMMQECLLGDKQ